MPEQRRPRASGEPPVDPDPWTVLVTVIGAIGSGLEIAEVGSKLVERLRGPRSGKTLGARLGAASDALRRTRTELDIIADIVNAADPATRLDLGTRLLLPTKEQHRRFRASVRNVIDRLKDLAKIVEPLEVQAARVTDDATGSERDWVRDQVGEARQSLRRVLRNQDISVGEALADCRTVIDQTQAILADLEGIVGV